MLYLISYLPLFFSEWDPGCHLGKYARSISANWCIFLLFRIFLFNKGSRLSLTNFFFRIINAFGVFYWLFTVSEKWLFLKWVEIVIPNKIWNSFCIFMYFIIRAFMFVFKNFWMMNSWTPRHPLWLRQTGCLVSHARSYSVTCRYIKYNFYRVPM